MRFDVLGVGCAAIDDVLHVDRYPAADAKCRVLRRERSCGGLTAAALIAAAREGATCAYAGALGDDESSRFVVESLAGEGVDVSHVVRRPDARPVTSTAVVDAAGTRTLFFSLDGVVAADPELPGEDVIRAARVLIVDHVGLRGAVRAAAVARRAGIPVVADVEGDGAGVADLAALADHLVVPLATAAQLTGLGDALVAVEALWRDDRATVIVTDGANGSWRRTLDDPAVVHEPAFPVDAADTTGCGDVFHGVYAAGLASGRSPAECVRRATAAAAVKAAGAGIPTAGATDRFLAEAMAR